jgi:hypothetical protein
MLPEPAKPPLPIVFGLLEVHILHLILVTSVILNSRSALAVQQTEVDGLGELALILADLLSPRDTVSSGDVEVFTLTVGLEQLYQSV